MYNEFLNEFKYMNSLYTPFNRSRIKELYLNRSIPKIQISKEILELIKDSISAKKQSEMFYEYLIAISNNTEDKEIIRNIGNDEIRHNQMLRRVYLELTGISLLKDKFDSYESEINITYLNGIKEALMGKLSSVEKYREILFKMEDRERYNIIMEIMTDELKNASKFNFLLIKNMKI